MNIALFGATGTIGQRILHEALQRGHTVTAIVRDPARLTETHPNLRVTTGDILDAASIATTVVGQDAVISSYGPREGEAGGVVEVAHTLIAGLAQAGVKRLVVVGGAGSLEVAPGEQLVDQPYFPAAWKAIALAARDARDVYRNEAGALDWSYFSPAAFIQPGERTGTFRLGTTQLVTDAEGNSRISAEDFALALLDEIEKPQFIQQQFTIGY